MLDTPSTTSDLDIPDLSGNELAGIAFGMEHRFVKPPETRPSNVPQPFFDACDKGNEAGLNLELLYLAERYDCVDVVLRALAKNSPVYASQVPSDMPGHPHFNMTSAEKLSARWVQATHEARTRAVALCPKGDKDQAYWVVFAGFFVDMLT